MRRVTLLAGLALALGVLLPGSALPAAGGSDLPFKGSMSGDYTVNLVTGQAHLVSTGPLSHFGLATLEQHGQVVPTGPGTFSISTTWTLTAANGDQMFGTATGTGSITADGQTLVANVASSGGTGRFADASLNMAATVQGTRLSVEGAIETGVFEVTFVGQLSY